MATQKIFFVPPLRPAPPPSAPALSPSVFSPPFFFPAPPGGSPKNRSYLKNFCAPEPADLTIPSGSTYALRAGPVVVAAPVAAVVVPICPAWCSAGWLLCVLALAVAVWCGLGCLLVLVVLCCGLCPLCWWCRCGWCVLCLLSACCADGAGCGFCRDVGRLLHGVWGAIGGRK